MFCTLLVSVLLALSPVAVHGQLDLQRNATGLSGTWSTGSGAVVTGPVSASST